jgi:hypothetical protein
VSDGININIQGVGDAIRRINAYSLQLSDKITMLALRRGAAMIKSAILSETPIGETGKLKRSIRVFTSKINKRNRNSKIGLFVRPATKVAWYAFNVENGFEVRGRGAISGRRIGSTGLRSGRKTAPSGKFVHGQLFVKAGWDKSKNAALQTITQSIETGSRDLAQRLGL